MIGKLVLNTKTGNSRKKKEQNCDGYVANTKV
jgi:hypothetical protein